MRGSGDTHNSPRLCISQLRHELIWRRVWGGWARCVQERAVEVAANLTQSRWDSPCDSGPQAVSTIELGSR